MLEINVRLASDFAYEERHAKDGDVYRTTSCRRGMVKIINCYPPDLRRLRGLMNALHISDFISLFEQMGFSIDVHPESANTKKEIKSALASFVNNDQLIFHDMIILVIVACGNTVFFKTRDNKKIYFDKIMQYFSDEQCKSMQGKPKMMFVNVKNIEPIISFREIGILLFDTQIYTNLLVAYHIWRFDIDDSSGRIDFCKELMENSCKDDVVTMLDNLRSKGWKYVKYNFGKCYLNPGLCRNDKQEITSIFEEKKKRLQFAQKKASDVTFIATAGEGRVGEGGGGRGGGGYFNNRLTVNYRKCDIM